MLSFGYVGAPPTLSRSPSRNRRLVGYGGYDVIVAAKPEACVVDNCRLRVDQGVEQRTGNRVDVEDVGQQGLYHQLQLECSSQPQRNRSFTIDSILSGPRVPTSITDDNENTELHGEKQQSQSDNCNADQNSLAAETVMAMDSCSRLNRFTASSSNGSEQSVISECCSSPATNNLPQSVQHSTGCTRFPVREQLLLHYQPVQYLADHTLQYASVNKYSHATTSDQNLTDVDTSRVQSFLATDASQSSWRYKFQQRDNPDESTSPEEIRPEHRGLTQHHRHRGKRIRTIFTADQLQRLEAQFERQQYMVGSERYYLASSLRLSEAQVKVWFQNRRIKWRKQSVERQQAKMAVVSYNKLVNDDDFNDAVDDSDSDFNDITTGSGNTDGISGPDCEYLMNDS